MTPLAAIAKLKYGCLVTSRKGLLHHGGRAGDGIPGSSGSTISGACACIPIPRRALHAVGCDHHLRARGRNPFPRSPYHNGSFSWTGSRYGEPSGQSGSGGSGFFGFATRLSVGQPSASDALDREFGPCCVVETERDPIERGIGLYEATELVRRYQDSFDWASVPIGKLRPR